jgi:hypothetical protein
VSGESSTVKATVTHLGTETERAVTFGYHSSTPLEVRLVVDGVIWTFGRDLLLDGLAGLGDVQVWPVGGRLCVALSGVESDGTWSLGLLSMRLWPVRRFLDRTLAIVPRGTEPVDFTVVDALIGGSR